MSATPVGPESVGRSFRNKLGTKREDDGNAPPYSLYVVLVRRPYICLFMDISISVQLQVDAAMQISYLHFLKHGLDFHFELLKSPLNLVNYFLFNSFYIFKTII